MTRRTINVDGRDWCADVYGDLTATGGSLNILNATAGACAVVPPPAGDPNAVAFAQLIYGGDDVAHSIANNVDMRSLSNIFGRRSTALPTIGFPFCSGVILQSTLARGKHWRARIDVPANAPTVTRTIQCVSYALPGHPLPNGWQLHSVRAAIVPAGADWSAASADQGAFRAGVTFSDQLLMSFSVGGVTSTARAELARGMSYDFLLAFDDPSYAGGVVLQMN